MMTTLETLAHLRAIAAGPAPATVLGTEQVRALLAVAEAAHALTSKAASIYWEEDDLSDFLARMEHTRHGPGGGVRVEASNLARLLRALLTLEGLECAE